MKDFLWRHKVLSGIWLVVFVIGGYGGYLLFFKSSGNSNPYVLSNKTSKQQTTEQSAVTEEPQAPKSIAAGQAAIDGDAEITVFGAKCDETTIGTNQYAMDEATGLFCRVSVSVKNTGSEPLSLPVSGQKLVVNDNKSYDMDVPATNYAQADPGKGNWYDQIAPGTTVTGDLVFDIPAAMSATKAVLHGGDDTSGLEVAL